MENKKRLHFSAIFENVLSTLVIVVVLLFSSLDEIVVNIMNGIDVSKYTHVSLIGVLIAIGVVVVVFLLVFLMFYIKWRNTYIYFQDEMFVIEKGKLFSSKVTIKLKDISNINIRRNVFEKIIGTCSLKLDLNTMSNANVTTKLIFKMNDALSIKKYILNNEVEEVIKEEKESLLKFSFKDVIKHNFLSINIVGMFWVLLIYLPIIYYLMSEFTMASIVVIVFMFVPVIWSLFSKSLNYFNFKLIDNGDHLTLTYGFFTTVTYHIYFDKINAVMINQTLQARICGKYLLEVVNAGLGNDDNEKRILSLYTDKKTIDYLMNTLLKDFNVKSDEIKQPKKAIITIGLNNIFILLIIICLSILVSKYFLLLFIILVLNIILSYSTKKIGFSSNFIVTNGIYNKTTAIINYDKIEQLTIEKGLFARPFGLNNYYIHIIGTSLYTVFKTGYFDSKYIDNVVKAVTN